MHLLVTFSDPSLYDAYVKAQLEYEKLLEEEDRRLAMLLASQEENNLDDSVNFRNEIQHEVPLVDSLEDVPQRPIEISVAPSQSEDLIECPICMKEMDISVMDDHIEECLSQDHSDLYNHEYDPVNMEEFECPICYCDVEVGNGYTFESCRHSYCGPCLNGYYSTLIMDGQVKNIVCPNRECDYKVQYNDVRYVLANDMLKKYEDFLRIQTVNEDPEMRWCPNPAGCGNAIRRKDTSSLFMACESCGTEFCFTCYKPFHPGKTCEDADTFNLADGFRNFKLKVWMKLHTKCCPNCQAPTQKRSGCNHMTCSYCRHEWCWECRKAFSRNHFEVTSCSQYSNVHRFIKTPIRMVKRALTSDSDYSSSDDESNCTIS